MKQTDQADRKVGLIVVAGTRNRRSRMMYRASMQTSTREISEGTSIDHGMIEKKACNLD